MSLRTDICFSYELVSLLQYPCYPLSEIFIFPLLILRKGHQDDLTEFPGLIPYLVELGTLGRLSNDAIDFRLILREPVAKRICYEAVCIHAVSNVLTLLS